MRELALRKLCGNLLRDAGKAKCLDVMPVPSMVSGTIAVWGLGEGPAVEIEKQQPARGVGECRRKKGRFSETPALGLVLEPHWLALGPCPAP